MQHQLHLEFLPTSVGEDRLAPAPDRPAVPPSVHFEFELFQIDGHVTTVVGIDRLQFFLRQLAKLSFCYASDRYSDDQHEYLLGRH